MFFFHACNETNQQQCTWLPALGMLGMCEKRGSARRNQASHLNTGPNTFHLSWKTLCRCQIDR